ncbi:hypothetical protein CHS0354_017183 [Potamilus streckersoni]|uniref:Vesicle transport protein n=1 Tax=Potamilus streckersoni TaxID=2493646 RepID=A0AAE0T2R9_9BIVA|nr:hypothetical protein CHS0354_017183 [Potamilus streckersoni]
MAKINDELKSYLSRNSSSPTQGFQSESSGSKFSLNSFNPFRKSPTTEENGSGDVANSWFSQAQRDPFCPSLTKKQRILGFVICLLLGTFCFSMACLYIPLLVLKARKFAALYTLGSLFVISSFSMLWGPANHVKHLFSMGRLPFTTAYLGTLFATLYCSLWIKSSFLTVICAVLQVLALVWYIVSYIPGGQTGLKFFTRICYSASSKTVQSILPV